MRSMGGSLRTKKLFISQNGISTKTTTDIGQARKTFETFGVDTNKKIVGTIAELHKKQRALLFNRGLLAKFLKQFL